MWVSCDTTALAGARTSPAAGQEPPHASGSRDTLPWNVGLLTRSPTTC
jgi:hypothetical protein